MNENNTPPTDLTPGAVYRIKWPDHYNRHQREVGARGAGAGAQRSAGYRTMIEAAAAGRRRYERKRIAIVTGGTKPR